MFTVALVGPDGCGKTTVATRLAQSRPAPALPLPAVYVYMGVNLETSNLVLPTTWLWLRIKKWRGRRPDMKGPPDSARRAPAKGLLRRAVSGAKAWLRLANLLGEEWFRQRVIASHRRRGRVVLLDRDFFADYYAHDVAPKHTAPRPWTSRLHGYLLRRFYRRPDVVIFLDAPADLLFQRKGEGTVELLERRRREYLLLREQVRHFHTIDASQPLESVLDDVRRCICEFQRPIEQTNLQLKRANRFREQCEFS